MGTYYSLAKSEQMIPSDGFLFLEVEVGESKEKKKHRMGAFSVDDIIGWCCFGRAEVTIADL